MERSEHKSLPEFTPHPAVKMHFVYILKNKFRRSTYYGYTNDLERRLEEHNQKGNWELIYYEAYKSETDARNRERRIKHYAQALTALKTRLKESLK